LNDFSAPGWGHIGYGVRPDERRKGYATLILKMALQKCGILGLDEVLLGCFKENIVSAEPFRTTVECPNTKSLKEKTANCCNAIGSGWTEQKVFF